LRAMQKNIACALTQDFPVLLVGSEKLNRVRSGVGSGAFVGKRKHLPWFGLGWQQRAVSVAFMNEKNIMKRTTGVLDERSGPFHEVLSVKLEAGAGIPS